METTYNYKVYFGNAPNPPTGTYVNGDWTGIPRFDFPTGTKIVMAWAHDSRMVIRFSFDSILFGDDIVLFDAAQAEPFYMSALAFQVQNYTSGSVSVWQVMGQW